MTIVENNQKALIALSKGHFSEAQKLLFENARHFPTHETYHNIGYFLCSEGLECKNGKVRNADRLGLQYLLKAEQMKATSINQSALAGECEKQRNAEFCRTGVDQPALCYTAWQHMERAVKLQYSHEAEYNRLRFWFLYDRLNPDILEGVKCLLAEYRTEDSAEFLLHLLCIHGDYRSCLELIPRYQDLLDKLGLLSLYCLCGDFAAGAALCDDVDKKFVLNDCTTAMMAECLIRSGKYASADALRKRQKEDLTGLPGTRTDQQKFDRIFASPEHRAKLIQTYCYRPPYVPMCEYFGCPLHGTPFYENHKSTTEK